MDRSSKRSREDRDRDRSHTSKDHHHRRDSDKPRHRDDPDDPSSRRSKDDRHRRHRSRSEDRAEGGGRKRKEHEEGAERGEKKARVSDGGERRERRRFGERAEDPREANGEEGRRERRHRDRDRVKSEEREDGEERRFRDRVKEEKVSDGEEMRFRDRAKEEKVSDGEERSEREERVNGGTGRVEERVRGYVKEENLEFEMEERKPVIEKSGSGAKAFASEPLNEALEVIPKVSASGNSPIPTKVSSITTPNENEGVNIIRSDEVTGKSSTDGAQTSDAGKSGNFSLDALAKARKVLQMRKELAEKLKKIHPVGVKKEEPQTSSSVQRATGTVSAAPSGKSSVPGSVAPLSGVTVEAVKRAQEVAARMGFHQDPQFAPLINMFPGPVPDVTIAQKPSKAPVLRLDAQGREIDEHGNVINVPKLTNLSTLKVNINKQKKEAFQILRPELDANVESTPHFDENLGINKTKLLRPKRMAFQFVEEGKWSRQAEITRLKNQFGEARAKELKAKQVQLEKAKAEPDINPNLIEVSERVIIKAKQKDPIPETEWWDVPLLPSGTYADLAKDKLNMEKITIYVEHPLPIQPPAEPAPPPPQPLKLTKKENKKLRTQRRLAKEKDRQEMIRQGLLEPPKPKVKMSNLMKVLGSEATQDPTRLEMEIRSAAAEREQAHVDRNIARKLTPAERREKKERKLFEDPSTMETIVTIYRVNHLSHPKTRFQVDVNAQENRMTGCAVISDDISVIVVEGVRKSNKRYKNLMMKRINWAAAVENEEEGGDDDDMTVNKCSLVWQGSVAKPSFHRFTVHQCRTEAAARKVFADAGVPHYWDLAVNYSDEI